MACGVALVWSMNLCIAIPRTRECGVINRLSIGRTCSMHRTYGTSSHARVGYAKTLQWTPTLNPSSPNLRIAAALVQFRVVHDIIDFRFFFNPLRDCYITADRSPAIARFRRVPNGETYSRGRNSSCCARSCSSPLTIKGERLLKNRTLRGAQPG